MIAFLRLLAGFAILGVCAGVVQAVKIETDPAGGFVGFIAEGRIIELGLFAVVCLVGQSCIGLLEDIRVYTRDAARKAKDDAKG